MIEIGGFVGLAALVIGLFAWMRADMRALRAELKGDAGRLRAGIADLRTELKGDIATLSEGQAELREGLAELRERMARLEGLLDGLREAVTWRSGPRDAA